jgi:hypothetical protein
VCTIPELQVESEDAAIVHELMGLRLEQHGLPALAKTVFARSGT